MQVVFFQKQATDFLNYSRGRRAKVAAIISLFVELCFKLQKVCIKANCDILALKKTVHMVSELRSKAHQITA